MLPKIAVTVAEDRTTVLKLLGLSENYIMSYEGNGAKVADFRPWLSTSLSIVFARPELSLVIWEADKLSMECQAVLLKPMEELMDKINLVLVVQNENRLSPTILSRGVVQNFKTLAETTDLYWSEVRKCWSSGPSACIAYVDQIGKDQGIPMIEEVIKKLKTGLITEVNKKRLAVLDLALVALYESKETNQNQKLSLDNFLIESWRMIKG